MHADLKPDNILLDRNFRAQVADFGLSCVVSTTEIGLCGTMQYQSPEQLMDESWDFKVDIFSAGIIFVEMISGQHPFYKGANRDEEAKNVVHCKFDMPTIADQSAISFIRQTLCVKNERLTADEAVEHPHIACKIQKVISSFQWAPPIFDNQKMEKRYTDHHAFYEILSDIDFNGCKWGNTDNVSNNEEKEMLESARVRQNELVRFTYLLQQ